LSSSAVLITGAPGAGKSTVLEALASVLSAAAVTYGAFEREQLEWGEPWLALDDTLALLAAVCRLQREAGRSRLLVTATTETEEELQATLAAIGAERSLVVCLTVAPDTASARVAAREPDWWDGKADLVAHARELALSIPALPGIDVSVANERRDAIDVAREIGDVLAARGLTK
jgi:hypothetical protein